ncbi:hypothetical protein L1887_34732 [Cichorium endivia]|nr:hypothetical protein L1887_34732 [Cichorium endivia]
MATKVIMVRECFAALFRAFKLSSFIRKCYFPHRHRLPSLSLRLHQPLTTSSSRRSSLPTPPVHAVAAFHVGIRSYPNIQYCPCPLLYAGVTDTKKYRKLHAAMVTSSPVTQIAHQVLVKMPTSFEAFAVEFIMEQDGVKVTDLPSDVLRRIMTSLAVSDEGASSFAKAISV